MDDHSELTSCTPSLTSYYGDINNPLYLDFNPYTSEETLHACFVTLRCQMPY